MFPKFFNSQTNNQIYHLKHTFGKISPNFCSYFNCISYFRTKFYTIMSTNKLIGRQREIAELQRCLMSDKSEFVVAN